MSILESSRISIVKVVEKQISAYNNRNIDEMMSCFCDDIVIANWDSQIKSVDGYEECKKMYSDLFQHSPELHAEVINTMVLKNKIIVHELVFGRKGLNEEIEQAIVFEIENDKIRGMTSIR